MEAMANGCSLRIAKAALVPNVLLHHYFPLARGKDRQWQVVAFFFNMKTLFLFLSAKLDFTQKQQTWG